MRALPILIAALALAGCGSGGAASGSSQSPKAQFAGRCGSCHTLADAGTSGTFGPNLDDVRPNKALVLATIEAGPGGMPAGLLEGPQADAVAGYVSSVAGR